MKQLQYILKKLAPYYKNKYLVAGTLFLVWLVFFDQNNLLERSRQINHLHQLQQDKVYYQKRIQEDSTRLQQLKTDKDNLERFAREKYYMKKDNEDIFVIVEED